jgi:hypothetical protein
MADKRAFAQFDVGYLDNPKIMEVFDASPIAICMHIASVLYCAQHLTDGIASAGPMQRKAGGSANDTSLLVDADLWHLPGHDCAFCPQPPDGKVYVHDYTEHNRTSEGVKRASQAGKRGAEALWQKKRNAQKNDADRMQTAYESHSEPQCDSDEIAMPREREREKERKNLKTPSSKPAASTDFDTFWASYPRKIGKEAARKAFVKAITKTTVGKIMDGVEQLRLEVAGKDPQFTPHAATWLNAGRWDDEVTRPTLAVVPNGYAWANR